MFEAKFYQSNLKRCIQPIRGFLNLSGMSRYIFGRLLNLNIFQIYVYNNKKIMLFAPLWSKLNTAASRLLLHMPIYSQYNRYEC